MTLNSLIHHFRWYIDGIPIRVFQNFDNEGIAYPNKQGMRVYSSLWNADNWATRGGLVKIDWNSSPFIARFCRFRARACKWDGPKSITKCAAASRGNWWTSPIYSQLSGGKMGQLKWVRDNYMIYDYCKDTKRFKGQMAPECFKQQFWYEDLQWSCFTPHISFPTSITHLKNKSYTYWFPVFQFVYSVIWKFKSVPLFNNAIHRFHSNVSVSLMESLWHLKQTMNRTNFQ